MAIQKVKCENKDCAKTFALNVKVGPEVDGKFEIYFVCPFCNKHYHAYFENIQTMSIQDQINELNSQVQNTRIIKKGMNFAKEFNKRQDYLEKINKLKDRKKLILEKINSKNNLKSS
jgi:uncharacterized radical SAM superfamily protein